MSSSAFTASPAATLFWWAVLLFVYMSTQLQALLRRAKRWPVAAQKELAELGREIEREVTGDYYASSAELEGIDRGLAAAKKRTFATKAKVERALAKFRVR